MQMYMTLTFYVQCYCVIKFKYYTMPLSINVIYILFDSREYKLVIIIPHLVTMYLDLDNLMEKDFF